MVLIKIAPANLLLLSSEAEEILDLQSDEFTMAAGPEDCDKSVYLNTLRNLKTEQSAFLTIFWAQVWENASLKVLL